MKYFLLGLIFYCVCLPTQADESAYQRGDFVKAAAYYEKLITESGANATLLFNLGNAYYQQGNYGLAIYAYERAKAISPRSGDIRKNLALAQEAASVNADLKRVGPLSFLSLAAWSMLAVVCFFILVVTVLLAIFWKHPKVQRYYTPVAIAAGVGLVISIIPLAIRYPELNSAVVTVPDAEVKLSPFDKADQVDTLNAGQIVHVKEKHKGFYHIDRGWVSAQEVQKIYQ